MISYQNFLALRSSAMDCETLDDFIAEEGGSVESDDVDEVVFLLKAIFASKSRPAINYAREITELSRAEFCRLYKIPLRSMENWEAGVKKPPEYVASFILFSVLSDNKYFRCG